MRMTLHRLSKILAALLIFSTISFCVASCQTSNRSGNSKNAPPSVPNIEQPRKGVKESAIEVGSTATNIATHADKIDKHTTEIETKAPPDVRTEIQPSIEGIRTETNGLRDDKATLVATQKNLENVEEQLKIEEENVNKWITYAQNADSANANLRDEVAKLKDENAATFKRMMAYLAVVCTAGIGICMVVAFFGRSKLAIAIAVGFGITLAISTAITLYMKAIALVTIIILGVAFVGVIGYMGWQALKNRKIEAELVHTGELTKQYLAPEAREHIFGYGAEPGKVDQIQTKATKERVKQIRQYNTKQQIKTAPSLPEYWRPPATPVRSVDPYLRPPIDSYSYSVAVNNSHRETII
jgi:hypothetical protein